MKKLKIKVNGKEYEVEVDVLVDTDGGLQPQMPSPFLSTPVQPSSVAAPTAAPPKPKASTPSAGGGTNQLTSPMNGVVLEIPVSSGSNVKSGQVVVVLEAMKMKTNISSARDGVVDEIKVRVNDSVESGQVLLTYK